jgi:hypothetical protein
MLASEYLSFTPQSPTHTIGLPIDGKNAEDLRALSQDAFINSQVRVLNCPAFPV